jgi:hypothetical protein
LVVLLAFGAQSLHAQSPAPPRPYDGIQAGLDAFRLAEEQRQIAAGRQLELNDALKFRAGLPTSRALAEYGYAVPPAGALWDEPYPFTGRWYWDEIRFRHAIGSAAWFGPWPHASGSAYAPPIRQPVGQAQTQTGPNRWESHPVYDPPLTSFQPLPPVESPLLDRTPYATPRRGPREY